jgi:hypothetical protein
MSNRHDRRSSVARYRHEASSGLTTYLVEPDDPSLHRAPLLRAAANDWLAGLTARVRSCIICSAWIVDREHVGALLLSTPVVTTASMSVCGVCRECWDADLGDAALERACAVALRAAVPGGQFIDAVKR